MTYVALSAQSSVVVNVQVLPPFSNYLSVYLDNPNKVVVTLQNTGRAAVDVKLKASLEGDNGVKIYTNDAFNPPAALHLEPVAFKRLDFSSNEVRQYLDLNNITCEGISKLSMPEIS